MWAMDTNNRPPEPLLVSIHDGRKEYRARTVSKTHPLPREAGGNASAFVGVIDVVDHDEKSTRTLHTTPADTSQHAAFELACEWLSHWLLDVRGVS